MKDWKSVLIIEAHGTLQRRQNLCAWLDREPAGDPGVWQRVNPVPSSLLNWQLDPAKSPAAGSKMRQDAARCGKMQLVDLMKVRTPDGLYRVYRNGVPDIPSQNGNLNGEVILNQQIWKLSGSLPYKPL